MVRINTTKYTVYTFLVAFSFGLNKAYDDIQTMAVDEKVFLAKLLAKAPISKSEDLLNNTVFVNNGDARLSNLITASTNEQLKSSKWISLCNSMETIPYFFAHASAVSKNVIHYDVDHTKIDLIRSSVNNVYKNYISDKWSYNYKSSLEDFTKQFEGLGVVKLGNKSKIRYELTKLNTDLINVNQITKNWATSYMIDVFDILKTSHTIMRQTVRLSRRRPQNSRQLKNLKRKQSEVNRNYKLIPLSFKNLLVSTKNIEETFQDLLDSLGKFISNTLKKEEQRARFSKRLIQEQQLKLKREIANADKSMNEQNTRFTNDKTFIKQNLEETVHELKDFDEKINITMDSLNEIEKTMKKIYKNIKDFRYQSNMLTTGLRSQIIEFEEFKHILDQQIIRNIRTHVFVIEDRLNTMYESTLKSGVQLVVMSKLLNEINSTMSEIGNQTVEQLVVYDKNVSVKDNIKHFHKLEQSNFVLNETLGGCDVFDYDSPNLLNQTSFQTESILNSESISNNIGFSSIIYDKIE